MEETITYVGLDVHKKSISVALAEGGRRGEARFFGTIPNKAAALTKLAERLSRKGGSLRFCYEAGPCGYGVYRHLRALGHDCVVVAPSLIPRRPGDRVKTDRRDALGLAKLDRAGELTAVWVPDADHEAMSPPPDSRGRVPSRSDRPRNRTDPPRSRSAARGPCAPASPPASARPPPGPGWSQKNAPRRAARHRQRQPRSSLCERQDQHMW